MTAYALTHCILWPGDGSRFAGHVVVRDGRIDTVGKGPYGGGLPAEDLAGECLSPGLIDLMLCGGFGCTLADGDLAHQMREYLKFGVTSCQACAGCLPWDTLGKIAEKTRRFRAEDHPGAASLLGVYWEGPFQHPDMTGASLRDYALPSSRENVARLLEIAGDVTLLVNVSPGAQNDLEGIRALREAGKTISMAHADSTAEHVDACIEAGTSVLGHVWNNNLGKLAEPGVQSPTIDHVGLTDPGVKFVHIVCDGTHVHPVMVRLVQRCKGTAGICLVTDALTGAGKPDGDYPWPDGRTFTKAGGVHRTADGHLAGSGLLLPDHLRNFVRFTGLSPHEAIRTVTLNPAASLGLEHEIGMVAPGRRADLVLWSEKLELKGVWKNGTRIGSLSEQAEVRL